MKWQKHKNAEYSGISLFQNYHRYHVWEYTQSDRSDWLWTTLPQLYFLTNIWIPGLVVYEVHFSPQPWYLFQMSKEKHVVRWLREKVNSSNIKTFRIMNENRTIHENYVKTNIFFRVAISVGKRPATITKWKIS